MAPPAAPTKGEFDTLEMLRKHREARRAQNQTNVQNQPSPQDQKYSPLEPTPMTRTLLRPARYQSLIRPSFTLHAKPVYTSRPGSPAFSPTSPPTGIFTPHTQPTCNTSTLQTHGEGPAVQPIDLTVDEPDEQQTQSGIDEDLGAIIDGRNELGSVQGQQSHLERAVRQPILWQNSNKLLLVPAAYGVMIAPTRGLRSSRLRPELTPSPEKPVQPVFKIYVGITTLECGHFSRISPQSGLVELIDRSGETAYARLTQCESEVEFCDRNGRLISPDFIEFKEMYSNTDKRRCLVNKLLTEKEDWEASALAEWGESMREWRIQRRTEEYNYIRHEVRCQNWTIFYPATDFVNNSRALLDSLWRYLVNEDRRETRGQIAAGFDRRSRQSQ